MRILFGVLGLLVVAAIVLSVARKQLQAVTNLPQVPVATSGVPASAPAGNSGLTVPQQSQNLQNKVANDVNRILQNAPARAEPQQ